MLGSISVDSRFGSLVEQLMQVERQPMVVLQKKENNLQEQLSTYGTLKNEFTDFQQSMQALDSEEKFEVYQANSSDDTVLTATASNAAAAGTYQLQVTQLAQSHKLGSAAFADKSVSLGASGTLDITVAEKTFSIAIDSSNDTLESIRDTINLAPSNDTVQATVMTVDDGSGGKESRLVLTAKATGVANSVSVSDVSGNVASTLNMSTQIQAPQDASLTVEGYTVTSASNTVEGALDGMVIDLNTVSGSTVTLTVEQDLTTITETIQDFVDSYNNLMDKLTSLIAQSEDHQGDTRRLKTHLSNDMRSLQFQLRDLAVDQTGGNGKYKALLEIGIISEGKEGKLSINQDDLENALKTNFNDVVSFFSDETHGTAKRFIDYTEQVLSFDGLIATGEDSVNNRLESIVERQERMNVKLEKLKITYTKRFAALDALVTRLESTQDFLTQQMDQLSQMTSHGGKRK